MPEDKERNVYDTYCRLAPVVIEEVKASVQTALRALGDPYVVRGALDSFRIKSFERLKQKAGRLSWTVEEACQKAQDFIGFRITCNNLQDVDRTRSLLEEALAERGYPPTSVGDYITKPKEDGYRAIHILFAVPIKIGKEEATLNCEIQIRSRLQDAWAGLSHADLYTASDVPPGIRTEMQRLAALLAKADVIADRIRERVARPRRGRKPTTGQRLSAVSLAFIYRRKFGSDAPDYVIQSILRDYGHLDIRTDGLATALDDERFVERLRLAYSSATRFEWEPEPEQLFRWVILSLVRGTKASIFEAARDSRAEADYIERVGRQEALAGFSEDAESLLSGIEHFDSGEDFWDDIEQWASGLGVLRRCHCGTVIVDPEEFADAAVRHLKLRGKKADDLREQLQEKVSHSGVDIGGWNVPSLCSHCDGVFSKDD